jgi:hypothetical protein
MKTKSITISGPWWKGSDEKVPTSYRVEKITDSLSFAPNEMLNKVQVQDLCEAGDWKVTIVKIPEGG